MATTVSLYQFQRALATQGLITTVNQAISAEVSDPVNIEWRTGVSGNVTLGDPLSNFVQNLYGYTLAQMQALFALAAGYSITTPVTTAGTLGKMKSRIADEIARLDLTSNISDAINDAIALYQPTRFYFNETGATGSTFNTVPNQVTYTMADDADIPYFYDIDDLFVTISLNNYRVARIDPSTWTILQIPTFKGQPYNYMWTGQTISLVPIPNTIYPMTITGHYKLAGPTDDTTPGNPWMVDAERLIRSTAKRMLFQDVIMDAEGAAAALGAEKEAKDVLKGTTQTMVRNGVIAPMNF